MKLIETSNLGKSFRIHRKKPGLKGSIKSLFSRHWETHTALADVSLSVKEGEIVGLLGANGAGKTTLVKCLSGIILPTAGSARVLGHVPFEKSNELRRQISLIMGQKAQLWWDLPAADCFLLLQEIYRIPPEEFKKRLKELTDILGVDRQLTVQIRKLSLGERMKMELIAALLHQPRVIFLDEPTIGLDFSTQNAVRAFILNYQRHHRPAMLLTSHYMDDIEKLCERIVVMRLGRVVYDGSIAQLITRAANHKVIKLDLKEAVRADATLPFKDLALLPTDDGKPDQMKIKVKRSEVTQVASWALQNLPVHDLTIEDPDVGELISNLQQSGMQP